MTARARPPQDGDDVGVLEPRGDPHLAGEALGAHALGELGPEHLDDDAPAEARVLGHEHTRHPRTPELTLERVGAVERRPQALAQLPCHKSPSSAPSVDGHAPTSAARSRPPDSGGGPGARGSDLLVAEAACYETDGGDSRHLLWRVGYGPSRLMKSLGVSPRRITRMARVSVSSRQALRARGMTGTPPPHGRRRPRAEGKELHCCRIHCPSFDVSVEPTLLRQPRAAGWL